MNPEVLLIAEQDEDGDVVAVWRKMPDEKTARPMRRNDLEFDDTIKIDYCGASKAEIVAYIETLPAACN